MVGRALLVATCACGRLWFAPLDGNPPGTADGIDAPASRVTCTAFGTPLLIPTTWDQAIDAEHGPWVTSDGLELFFHQNEGVFGGDDIYVATRTGTSQAFTGRTAVAMLSSSNNDGGISLR